MVSPRPDPDHDRVCACAEDHLLVTAPPGTGKTFLTIRLAGALTSDLPTGARVLVLTFSNQARTQLEEEARRQLTPEQRRRTEITNYHRFFWKSVLAYRRLLGLPMEIDIGSSKRRRDAFAAELGAPRIKEIGKASPGLLDSLAEHAFACFRDERTPRADELNRMLAVVRAEVTEGRLVFDDLGALFWKLLRNNPAVAAAYGSRYPIVIADEHQDASALQDAVARKFGTRRLIVMADEMQLIHGFRGARQERIEAHRSECGAQETLRTTHRWHGSAELGEWLLAVRERLQGQLANAPQPEAVAIRKTDGARGFNGVKTAVKFAVASAFKHGHKSIAVLARTNQDVAQLRSYLTKHGFFPREAGTADFEDARNDIEQLPLAIDSEAIARHALGRLETLLPTVPPSAFTQASRRIGRDGIDLHRAGNDARMILAPLQRIYDNGTGQYFGAVMEVITSAASGKHHLPRAEAVHALRQTALAMEGAGPICQGRDGREAGGTASKQWPVRYDSTPIERQRVRPCCPGRRYRQALSRR